MGPVAVKVAGQPVRHEVMLRLGVAGCALGNEGPAHPHCGAVVGWLAAGHGPPGGRGGQPHRGTVRGHRLAAGDLGWNPKCLIRLTMRQHAYQHSSCPVEVAVSMWLTMWTIASQCSFNTRETLAIQVLTLKPLSDKEGHGP